MRILIYLVIAILLASCHKSELMSFQQEKSSVYFYLDKKVAKNEVVKSFTATFADQLVMNIPVRCSGLAAAVDRTFKAVVVVGGTTARATADYEPLAERYVFPANAYEAYIPVVLNRTELLKDSTLVLELALTESNDFGIGEKLRQNVFIRFSDQLEQPDNWGKGYGAYSRVKHQVFLVITEREAYPTPEEWEENKYYFSYAVSRALSAYFRDNYPVKDENGNIINPW